MLSTSEKNGIGETMVIAALIILSQRLQVTLLSPQNNVELYRKEKRLP